MVVRAVRGAVQIDSNSSDSILLGVSQLVGELVDRNRIEPEHIVSIMFSQTRDITALNPATALRTEGFGSVPLFCTQEPEYDGAMPRIVRILLTYETDSETVPVPVYINGAENLRSDLFAG